MTTDKTDNTSVNASTNKRQQTWTKIVAPGVEIVKHEGTPEHFVPWPSVHKACSSCGQEFIRFSTMKKEVEAKWTRCAACHLKQATAKKMDNLPEAVAKAWAQLGGK